jgi:hypothetical protein
MQRESCGSPCKTCVLPCGMVLSCACHSLLLPLCQKLSTGVLGLVLVVVTWRPFVDLLPLSDRLVWQVSSRPAASTPRVMCQTKLGFVTLMLTDTMTISPAAICSCKDYAHFQCPRSGSVGTQPSRKECRITHLIVNVDNVTKQDGRK